MEGLAHFRQNINLLNLVHVFKIKHHLTVHDYYIWWGQCIILQATLRTDYLKLFYWFLWGIRKMISTARDSVWWHGIGQDIKLLAHKCDVCKSMYNSPNIHANIVSGNIVGKSQVARLFKNSFQYLYYLKRLLSFELIHVVNGYSFYVLV